MFKLKFYVSVYFALLDVKMLRRIIALFALDTRAKWSRKLTRNAKTGRKDVDTRSEAAASAIA